MRRSQHLKNLTAKSIPAGWLYHTLFWQTCDTKNIKQEMIYYDGDDILANPKDQINLTCL